MTVHPSCFFSPALAQLAMINTIFLNKIQQKVSTGVPPGTKLHDVEYMAMKKLHYLMTIVLQWMHT